MAGVENQYSRVVSREGNVRRGPDLVGLRGLRPQVARHRHDSQVGLVCATTSATFDAERRFEVGAHGDRSEPAECISGQILRGLKKPHDCPAFGSRCTPAHPLGATMVSAEGACAAYHAYGGIAAEPVAGEPP